MPRIRVGVQIHPQHTTYASLAEAARRAEALGVDTLWDWDHFFPLYGPKDDDRHFEGWTLLTAFAMLTERVEVGCMVTCNSYRNAALLTHMAKTVDHISNGRLILGIGAGWFERDYDEYGYTFGTARERLQALGASLEVIQRQMAKESPPPVRNPIPIMIGGEGEQITLRLVAQYASMWNTFGPPEKYARKNAVLNEWCDKLGRNPAEIERTVGLETQHVPRDLDGLLEAGATHFILGLGEPWDFDKVEALLRWRETVSS